MADPDDTGAVLHVVPSKTDEDLAREVREELRPLLEDACEVMNRAIAHGLDVTFMVNRDQHGRMRIASITVVRPL